MKIIVIQGPARSGKTLHADRFAAHYGISNVIDYDRHHIHHAFPQDSAIILTQHSREAVLSWRDRTSRRRVPTCAIQFVPIDSALRLIGGHRHG